MCTTLFARVQGVKGCECAHPHVVQTCVWGLWVMVVLKGFCPRMPVMDGEREREPSQMADRGEDDLHNNQQQEKKTTWINMGDVCV